jgi:flagellar M-ring protein FliF
MTMRLQEQALSFWKKQTGAQRVTFGAILLAAAILIPILLTWASKPSYSVAYSGLNEADAGEIVQKMDEAGIDYQLKGSSTILVQSDQVYQTRLRMAREGLPQESTVGYELFSGNTLGMTEFTQRVNYQRALEGELERTIASIDSVEAVRVHVVTPERSLLSDDQQPTTASITIQERPGSSIDGSQVRAISHLVASSVEGLKPENVVVVDSNGNLLAGGMDGDMEGLATQSDNQRAAEAAAALEVKKRVQAMLDQILGPNHSVVQASVQMDWTQREVTSSAFNPTPAAIRSEQHVSESYNTNGQTAGGVPGAGSNLPTPIPGVAGQNGSSVYTRTEDTVNYEISQVQTLEKIAPGQVKNLSISVMVDNVTDPQKLESIRAAVAAAAGVDETRGDLMVVETLEFDRTYFETQQADLQEQAQMDTYLRYGSLAAVVVVMIVLLVFFQRSLGRIRRGTAESWKPILKPVSEMTMLSRGPAAAAAMDAGMLAGLNSLPGMSSQSARPPEERSQPERTSRMMQSFPEDEQLNKVVTRLTEENPATVAEIIQIWLSEDERRNG